jgi:hypothetical protein
LESLLGEACLSRRRLAERIRTLSVQRRRPVHTTGTSVTRWIRDGDRPHPWTRQLLQEVLSAKLGRPLTMIELGMGAGAGGQDPAPGTSLVYSPSAEQTVQTLTELTHVDLGSDTVDRRQFLALASFSVGGLSAPSRDWLVSAIATAPHRPPRRVTSAQVAAIRDTFTAFQGLDTSHGGGHARLALVQYLKTTVLPLLNADHDGRTRTDLFSAAAEHAYLAAWMSWDDALPGMAQRYFTQALRLAQEAGDPLLGAHILTGTAHLTIAQGQPAEALQLLRAALAGAGTSQASPAVLARMLVLQARALALLGESASAASALHAAEQAHDRINPGDMPRYADYIDVAYLAGETAIALAQTGQTRQAEQSATTSLQDGGRGSTGRRAAFTFAALAGLHTRAGDVEAAAIAAEEAVTAAGRIHSHRALQAITQARVGLTPHRAHPKVAAALDQMWVRLPQGRHRVPAGEPLAGEPLAGEPLAG